jgi:hypothetical protein
MLFCVNPAGDLLKLHHIISISISIIAHRRTTARIARAGAERQRRFYTFYSNFRASPSLRSIVGLLENFEFFFSSSSFLPGTKPSLPLMVYLTMDEVELNSGLAMGSVPRILECTTMAGAELDLGIFLRLVRTGVFSSSSTLMTKDSDLCALAPSLIPSAKGLAFLINDVCSEDPSTNEEVTIRSLLDLRRNYEQSSSATR